MAISKIKFPSPFLRERRIRLGLDPCEVAREIGISLDLYRQIEHRGQLPDEHIPKLAISLKVTENELRAEKIAAMVETMFGIPRADTHGFIAKASRK